MKVIIRRAKTTEDLKFMARGIAEVRSEFFGGIDSDTEQLVELLKRNIKDRDVLMEVASLEDSPIGFNLASLNILGKESLYGKISVLFVDPRHRGKGVGTALKESGEKWLRSKGASFVVTDVSLKNERMIEMNKRFGFRITGYAMQKEL